MERDKTEATYTVTVRWTAAGERTETFTATVTNCRWELSDGMLVVKMERVVDPPGEVWTLLVPAEALVDLRSVPVAARARDVDEDDA